MKMFNSLKSKILQSVYTPNSTFVEVGKCKVTNLQIVGQPSESKFINVSTLKYLYSNAPNVFQALAEEYAPKRAECATIEDLFYYMAHNIRNQDSNARNNRIRTEMKRYPPNQYRLFDVSLYTA
uniref:hypothetical protein n=1 Tax=Ornithobacterium rhinotracheale TaxID=28251 RepID=UPI00129C4D6C|nr:hypothetical protein [Ornithobacterium rhinotracheale]